MKNSKQTTKAIKRTCQIVAIHVVLLTVLFANEPLRVNGLHRVIYDAVAQDLLDVRWTFGLFSKPRAENIRVTFLAKFASGKEVEWSPVNLDSTPIWEKGHEAIMRNWLDENIGDHGTKTNPLLLRDAAKFAAKTLSEPNDAVKTVEIIKTAESIPPPNSTELPRITQRIKLFTLDATTGEGHVETAPEGDDERNDAAQSGSTFADRGSTGEPGSNSGNKQEDKRGNNQSDKQDDKLRSGPAEDGIGQSPAKGEQ